MPRASAARELLASREDVWQFIAEPGLFALVIGILVGVALASHGLGHAERQQLEHDLHAAQSDNGNLQSRLREYRKDAAFVDNAYDAVMQNRLHGMRIGVLFIGKVDE